MHISKIILNYRKGIQVSNEPKRCKTCPFPGGGARGGGGGGGGVGSSLMAYTGMLCLKGIPVSGFRYEKGRVEISLDERYEKVGKSVISVCDKVQKPGLTDSFIL